MTPFADFRLLTDPAVLDNRRSDAYPFVRRPSSPPGEPVNLRNFLRRCAV